jgi:lysophospholipase L1-like esterase
LGKGIVRVVNLAVGGTGTNLSTTIIKYKLYPNTHPFLRDQGPDIIINAYSTNDAGGSDKFNYTYDTASQAQKREIAQQFIRACRDAGPCIEPPMIVYLDDYLGNRTQFDI